MVLAADVFNLDGQILFTKGAALTTRQIDILQSWGIPNVEVEGDEKDSDEIDLEEFPPDILKHAEQIVAGRFKLTKSSHPAVEIVQKMRVMQEAKKLVKARKQQK